MTTTIRHTIKFALLTVMFLALHVDTFSQIKVVTGFVYNKTESTKKDKKPLDTSEIELKIYGYNSEEMAEDDLKRYKNTPKEDIAIYGFTYNQDETTEVDNYGNFEIEIALTGALLVQYGMTEPQLVPIKGQMHVEIGIEVGERLDEVSVKGKFTGIGKLDVPPPIQHGNVLTVPGTGIKISDEYINEHSRLTIIPYVVNNTVNDTAHFRKPKIYDGREFHLTQQRWEGYKEKSDSLMRYVQPQQFNKGNNIYEWSDTIILPNDEDAFQLVADIVIEDYLGRTYFDPKFEISPKYPRKPMRFLEYSVEAYDLDPNEYKERPKRERRDQAADLALTFVVGQAEIDYSNPRNKILMDSLQMQFNEYINDKDVTFKKLILSSVSSPDGTLASNMALARRRLEFARSEISKMFPPSMLRIMYVEAEQAEVATWEDVARLLERDSLTSEAQSVRDIISRYPNQDTQSSMMRSLSCYDTIRTAYLPRLRRMKCEYTVERYRALSAEEIMDLYLNDPDYKSGKKKFAPYEYWNLFQTVKDSMALEKLYKDAYEESRAWSANGVPWILAANNLAASYIRRDTADFTVLAPFLNDSLKINAKRYGRTFNQPELVANQAVMYMKSGNYEKAMNWAWRLKDMPKYHGLTDVILCLGGYYMYDASLFNRVRHSSPLNDIVMCLAMGTADYAKQAIVALDDMPDLYTTPKLLYLRAIAYSRLGSDFDFKAQESLSMCFNVAYESGDKSWVELARTDGDIKEDLFESAYYMSYWYLYDGEDL